MENIKKKRSERLFHMRKENSVRICKRVPFALISMYNIVENR